MTYLKSLLIALIIFLHAGKIISAQPLPDSMIVKINGLFSKWDKKGSPGCAVGIVRNDSLIFSRGYGMANLEYSIPNTDSTIFHIASLSKQFTAFQILMLEKKGKLHLDDDIRIYLPWFPKLADKITIRQLLHHTSGIRDQWQLLAIAGTRLDDVITQGQIIKILSRQQALNFKPGEKFNYSNSGYTLLAEIVQALTRKSFRRTADSIIFSPLGMKHSHFHDDYKEIVFNRADSYERKDSATFLNSVLSYSTVGATSLFTNVIDLSKWVMNFYDPKIGDSNDILRLTQKGKLNSGKELDYGAGVHIDNYKGWERYSHGGSDAGFRTSISIFPELKLGFIVLANVDEINAGEKSNQMSELFVPGKTEPISPERRQKNDQPLLSTDISMLKKFVGAYISDEGFVLSLELKNDSLYYSVGNNNYLLVKDSDRIFSMFFARDMKFVFGDGLMVETGNEELHFTKYLKISNPDDRKLQEYTGVYYSPELDCDYTIKLKDHSLFLSNNKYADAKLTFAGSEHLLNDNWWMNHLVINRDSLHQITGFEVNAGRVMHLKFIKMPKGRNE